MLCGLVAGKTVTLAAAAFTLSWTHSVEKIAWQEDWLATPAGLTIVEARVKGSGAGMEPGEGAVFDGSWWRWRPRLGPQPRIILARSGAAGAWRLCSAIRCTEIDRPGAGPADPVVLEACPER